MYHDTVVEAGNTLTSQQHWTQSRQPVWKWPRSRTYQIGNWHILGAEWNLKMSKAARLLEGGHTGENILQAGCKECFLIRYSLNHVPAGSLIH